MNTKKIAIVTDTNSGLMPNSLNDKGIFVLPMPFVVEGECFLESVDLSRDEFYQKLVAGTKITTSQPSVGDVSDFWTEILKDYDQIVHIPTSSCLSAACATAKNLAQEFEGKVFVVDNLRISAPLLTSAFDAAALRDQGKTAEEIVEILLERKSDFCVYFSLESMEYLKRGGRISPTVAAIGSILKLRPILQVKEGKLEKFALPRTLAKAKELMKNAILEDLKEKFKKYLDNGEMRMMVVYGESKEDALAFEEEMKKHFPNVPFLPCSPMSLSVACHTGPNVNILACLRVIE